MMSCLARVVVGARRGLLLAVLLAGSLPAVASESQRVYFARFDDDGNGRKADLEPREMVRIGGPAPKAATRKAEANCSALAQGSSGRGGH